MSVFQGLIKRMLWLDAGSRADESVVAALALAGWHLEETDTLEGLSQPALAAIDAVAVRIDAQGDLLTRTVAALAGAGVRRPVVCRVDGGDLLAAARAARMGASHVVASDDFSLNAWRDVCTLGWPAVSEPESPPGTPRGPAGAGRLTAVFVDPTSRHLLALSRRVAQAEVTTLVVGPTGAGKEVLARVLHEASPRAHAPFVAFNCAALPEHLIESLLFGHEKGAFTGAHRDHRGLFEQAQGGTLFLDEIGDMPLHLQARLLRVLQERQVTRLGSTTTVHLDVRVIAATAQDLKTAIAQRQFREDLFYRIATFQLRLAPLAERPGDILPLARAMLERHRPADAPAWQLGDSAAAVLLAHRWPGNVRELDNVMRRAVVLADGPTITSGQILLDDAPMQAFDADNDMAQAAGLGGSAPEHGGRAQAPMPPPAGGLASLPDAVRDNEVRIVSATLAACASRDEAARRLGISPRTLRHKLAQWRQQGLIAA
ncbi:MAG: Nitrogen assimilation regulatory protein [Pseudomonadota bacterium]|jgi:two-component system response regulator FlrC